jgi:hypothetical protein
VSNWAAAEIILGIAVLALAMPREDVLLIPEYRDWLAPLRRLLPKARRLREDQGAREAEEYVTALRAEPETMVVRRSDLPVALATVPVKQLSPDEAQAPWAPAAWSPPPGPEVPAVMPPKVKRNAPTIVMKAVRPEIERNLRPYLNGLPSYEED